MPRKPPARPDSDPTEAPPFVPDREHVVGRLAEMLDQLRRADTWPWRPSRERLNRETVWPYLLGFLPEAEAEQWRTRLEAEARRLDQDHDED